MDQNNDHLIEAAFNGDRCSQCGSLFDYTGSCLECDYCKSCGRYLDLKGCCPNCDYCSNCGQPLDQDGYCIDCDYCETCGWLLEEDGRCSNCQRDEDLVDDWQGLDEYENVGCSCPICRGDPASDPFFRKFEPDGYSSLSSRSELRRSLASVSTPQRNLSAPMISSPYDFLAFDLEIAREISENAADWSKYRPFGITCAATMDSQGNVKLWYSCDSKGQIARQMNQPDLENLVNYLQNKVSQGSTLLTWNGLGFDFDVLAEESGQWEACKTLALNHVDMMFQIFCMKGFTLALEKAAKGFGLAGKLPGVDGSKAPKLWAAGKYQLVQEYVAQDVRTTMQVARLAEQSRMISWISQSGKFQTLLLPNGWMTVSQAADLPEPDTSWMENPWTRDRFTKWTAAPTEVHLYGSKKDEASMLGRLKKWLGF